jgi:hypothetical protein
MVATRLRLALSLSSIRQTFEVAQIAPGDGGGGEEDDGGDDLNSIFGILLQDASGFLITHNSEVIIRQLADKNIIIMQDGFDLVTQAGHPIVLEQDYLNLQEHDTDSGLREFVITQSGEELIIG